MPTISLTMSNRDHDHYASILSDDMDIKKELTAINNWHNPEPKNDAPLAKELLATPFWVRMKNSSQAEKDTAFGKYALNIGYPYWRTQRYQIAAAVSIAKADPRIKQSMALAKSITYEDIPLTYLLLAHDANPNTVHDEKPLIFSAKSLPLAKALVAFGAQCNARDNRGYTVLHHAVDRCIHESALISYYGSMVEPSILRAKETTSQHSPLELLIIHTSLSPFLYDSVLPKYLDEFKKAGITHEEIVAAHNKLKSVRDAADQTVAWRYTQKMTAIAKYLEKSKR